MYYQSDANIAEGFFFGLIASLLIISAFLSMMVGALSFVYYVWSALLLLSALFIALSQPKDGSKKPKVKASKVIAEIVLMTVAVIIGILLLIEFILMFKISDIYFLFAVIILGFAEIGVIRLLRKLSKSQKTLETTFEEGKRETSTLLDLSPIEFEKLVSELLKAMGFKTQITKASHDGGIDVIAILDKPIIGGKYVIQCKRYKNTVPVKVIREPYGVMQSEKANKGILITTSDFSSDGYKFASDKQIELINREKLLQLIREYLPDSIYALNNST